MNIPAIIELYRRRVDWHRAEKSLTLQAKAVCRRLCAGDKSEADVLFAAVEDHAEHPMAFKAQMWIAPFLEARGQFAEKRKEAEKALAKMAATLPCAPWVESIRGFGILSLAQIVGEAGDLCGYSNPAKLWKRMGLAVINGGRQRRVTGDEALVHGYSPARRSVMWNVGQCVFKAQSAKVDKETGEVIRPAGHYRALYDTRKELEQTRCETKKHAHNRACRYMEKRLLRDLWRAWNGKAVDVDHYEQERAAA